MTVKIKPAILTRRFLLMGGSLSLFLTKPAFAKSAPLLKLPASVVFLKLDADGALPPSTMDRRMWNQFSMNLGALISRIEPIPHNYLIPGGELTQDSGRGSAILTARLNAQTQGYDYLIVYGTVSRAEAAKYRSSKKVNPALSFSRRLRSKLPFWNWDYTADPYTETRTEHLDMMGEAHLLDLNGGAPLASSWADLPKRSRLERWTSKDERHEEIVQLLVDGMQIKIQELSMQNFESERSISQRF